jgi:preprotein translocase subunit SecD
MDGRMLHYSRWQTAAILGVAMLVSLAAVPNVLPASARAALPAWAQRTFVLGYDLLGGEHVQFSIDANDVRQQVLETTRDEVRNLLRYHRVSFTGLAIRNDGVEVWIREAADMPLVADAFEKLVRPLDPAPLMSDRQALLIRHTDGRPSIWAGRDAYLPSSDYRLDIADRMVRLSPTEDLFRRRVRQSRDHVLALVTRRLRELDGEKLVTLSARGEDRIVLDARVGALEGFRRVRF